MFSFTYKGIIFFILQDDHFMKNTSFNDFSYHIPWTIKDEFNRVYELDSSELKLPWKSPVSETTEEWKKETAPEMSLSSMKKYLKLAKKTSNSLN